MVIGVVVLAILAVVIVITRNNARKGYTKISDSD